MGLIFSIGVIWITYQIFNSVEVFEKKQKSAIVVRSNSDRKAA